MRVHPFYQRYPVEGVQNLGARKGYFHDLDMYCAMGFDKKVDVDTLCEDNREASLFVWNNETMEELKRRGGSLKKLQLDAIAYLWEMFYDLALADETDNVSVSPGFESFGLRGNNMSDEKKRKRED